MAPLGRLALAGGGAVTTRRVSLPVAAPASANGVACLTAGERKPAPAVDLLSREGTGPLWGMASADLNATLLAWPPGHEVAAHTNSELDVLLIVLEGSGVAKVEQQEHALVPGTALLVEKGSSRVIRAGPDGLRYLSVHRRRGPLQVAGMPKRR